MPTITRAEDLAMVGANGGAWTVDMGVATPTAPADFSALSSPWLPVGAISDNGLKIGFSEDNQSFTPWGETTPFRTVITKSVRTVDLTLWETNRAICKSLWYRQPVSAFTPDGQGVTSFAESASPPPDRRAWVWDVYDGNTLERYFAPIAEVTDRTDVTVKQNEMISYEIKVTAYPDDAGNTIYHLCTVDISGGSGTGS